MADAGEARGRSGVSFEENPILNSPYEEPTRHWPLDDDGRPQEDMRPADGRRRSKYVLPVPPSEQGGSQRHLTYESSKPEENKLINEIRAALDEWRAKPVGARGITTTTERLLDFWSSDEARPRLFFCQREAAETLIWLNEVAPTTDEGEGILARIRGSSDLYRLACKMATGSGKTTVMAMMIAYHAINAGRHKGMRCFARNFLIITPGLTVRDRLQVLRPKGRENYYRSEVRRLVPEAWERYLNEAEIVVSNSQKFQHRVLSESLTTAQKAVLRGHARRRAGRMESDALMLERVWNKTPLPEGNILVINDEAHHCYRRKEDEGRAELSDEEKEEAERNNEEARLWISGIEDLRREVGERLLAVYDLSATPSYLRGSGYTEGVLFPWVVSDFSLLDAIESGVVKIPRVPVRDDTAADVPIYRNVYRHVSKSLPKKGRSKGVAKNPDRLHDLIKRGAAALYRQYKETAEAWCRGDVPVPPVFIFVCNNTSTSDLVFRHFAGWRDAESGEWQSGSEETPAFHNAEKNGEPCDGPRSILVDSYQLGTGKKDLSRVLLGQMECLRKWCENHGDERLSAMSDRDLLRETLNTVGQLGKIGEQVRCVVSVSMLTEGWDARNVTHIFGIRAFGTQLLCEQVVGRALRRQSYETFVIDEEGRQLFTPEYADIFGVPFTFAQGSKVVAPSKVQITRVRALRSRGGESGMVIKFPRLDGYSLRLPNDRLQVDFDALKGDFTYPLKLEDDPNKTMIRGVAGEEGIVVSVVREKSDQEIAYELAPYVAQKCFAEKKVAQSPHLLSDLLDIVSKWVRECVICERGAKKSLILLGDHREVAAERIRDMCGATHKDKEHILRPDLDEYNEESSTNHIDFLTRKRRIFDTTKSHVNHAVCDSDWEMEVCGLLEAEPSVLYYANNDIHERGLNFSIPYTFAFERYSYFPDFIVVVDDGRGRDDPLKVVLEVKGIRDRKAGVKADTAKHLWVPAVNNDGRWGRWAFFEVMDPQNFEDHVASLAALAKGENNGTS